MTRKEAAFCMGWFHGKENGHALKPSEVQFNWPELNDWEVAAYCGGRAAGVAGNDSLLPVKEFDINQVSALLRLGSFREVWDAEE